MALNGLVDIKCTYLHLSAALDVYYLLRVHCVLGCCRKGPGITWTIDTASIPRASVKEKWLITGGFVHLCLTLDVSYWQFHPWTWMTISPCLFLELVIYSCVENACMDARVSELRVVELLDGLCAKMKPYVPSKVKCSIHWHPAWGLYLLLRFFYVRPQHEYDIVC